MPYIGWIIGIFLPVALVTLFFKQRYRSIVVREPLEGPIEGSDAEREQDERRLRESPLDIREQILETMEIQGRYATRRGYSEASFGILLKQLRENGIAGEIFFQPFGMLGFGDSLIVQQGIFELYIERGKLVAAQPFIERWENT